MRRRWTTSLAALATLVSTALGAAVVAAPAASALTNSAWQSGTQDSYQSINASFNQYYCSAYGGSYCSTQDELSQKFTATATGGVAKVVLSTPYSYSAPPRRRPGDHRHRRAERQDVRLQHHGHPVVHGGLGLRRQRRLHRHRRGGQR